MAENGGGDESGAVSAITKFFPDLNYDLISRLPAGFLAVVLTFWIRGVSLADITWIKDLSWPPGVALLLLLFPFLYTVGVILSAVSLTLVAWWLRPLVFLYLQKRKSVPEQLEWRRANRQEFLAFKEIRTRGDAFAPILTKSRAEMALATNLLSTYLLMAMGNRIWGSNGFPKGWWGLGVLLFMAAVSRTTCHFRWLLSMKTEEEAE